MKKTLIAFLFLLLSVCSFCWSEPLSTVSPVQGNLTQLEQLMTNLQNGSITQQIQIEDLQKRLETADLLSRNLEMHLAETLEQSEKQSKLLKKRERQLELWKWSSGFGIPIAFTAGLTLGFLAINLK